MSSFGEPMRTSILSLLDAVWNMTGVQPSQKCNLGLRSRIQTRYTIGYESETATKEEAKAKQEEQKT